LKQGDVSVSYSHLLQVIWKQAGDIISHSHLLLFFGAHDFTLFFKIALFRIKSCSLYIIKQFSTDSIHELVRPILGFHLDSSDRIIRLCKWLNVNNSNVQLLEKSYRTNILSEEVSFMKLLMKKIRIYIYVDYRVYHVSPNLSSPNACFA